MHGIIILLGDGMHFVFGGTIQERLLLIGG